MELVEIDYEEMPQIKKGKVYRILREDKEHNKINVGYYTSTKKVFEQIGIDENGEIMEQNLDKFIKEKEKDIIKSLSS